MDQRDPLLRKKLKLELTSAVANMEAGEMIQGSRALTALLENQFPASMPGNSELPVTLAPGILCLCLLWPHLCAQTLT